MNKPVCAKCGSQRTSRRERVGFFQKTIMSGLGFYPWECATCWKRFYSSERGQRIRRGQRRSDNTTTDATTLEASGQ
jgi:DNA-directed RNA polymerase subunit RPC12/RpoP